MAMAWITILDFKGKAIVLKGTANTDLIDGDKLGFELLDLGGSAGLVNGTPAGKWHTLESSGLASSPYAVAIATPTPV